MRFVEFLSEGCEGYLAFGYSNKKQALKAIDRYDRKNGGDGWDNDIKRITVYRYKKDGEDWFDWSGEQKQCPCCGAKRKGVVSYIGYI